MDTLILDHYNHRNRSVVLLNNFELHEVYYGFGEEGQVEKVKKGAYYSFKHLLPEHQINAHFN